MDNVTFRMLLYFGFYIVVLSAGICVSLCAVLKKKWKWLSEKNPDPKASAWYAAHSKKIKRLVLSLKILLTAWIIFSGVCLTGYLRDIPNILHKNYLVISGITLTQSLQPMQKTELRDITLKEAGSGSEFRVHVFTHGIRRGELITVYVLPVTMIGFADRG